MGIVFEEPLLESVESTIKGKIFVLYEINGADYWDHVLSAESFATADEQVEEQTSQERYEVLHSNAQKKLQLISLSLQPGYPDTDIELIKNELSKMLTMKQQQALYDDLVSLMGWTNPNVQAPDESSSTD